MSDVLNPNYNNYPEQVEENKRDIKALLVKFKTSEVLNSSSSIVDKSTTNIPERCNICEIINSFIYSQNGLVFKIVAITGNKVFIDFYSDLSNQGGGSYSTQNMLINPAFIINQDAMQDYSGDGIYTADQWIMESAETIVSPIQTGGATFRNNGSEEHFIQQIVEVSDELNTIGKPHTASVELENGTKAHVTITPLAGTDVQKKISFEGGSISIEWDASEDFLIYRIYANPGVTLNIKNTMLVPSSLPGIFVPRSYGEELKLCQRFYWCNLPDGKTTYSNFGFSFNATVSRTDCFISLPCQMRVKPIVKFDGLASIPENKIFSYVNGVLNTITGATIGKMYSNTITIQFTTSNITPNEIGVVRTTSNSVVLSLDARIY